jgi:hypothetical protein
MQFWQHLLLAVTLATLTLPANAVSVSVNEHDLYHTLDNTLPLKAGEYYSNKQTINTTISINGLGLNLVNWTLTARIADYYGTNMHFAIKRTGSGEGDGTISDGESNLNSAGTTISTGTGTGNRINIPFTITISNFDVNDGNGTKDIKIEYQVTTTPITTP